MNVRAICLQRAFCVCVALFGASFGENVALEKSTGFKRVSSGGNATVEHGIIQVVSAGSRPRCAKACLGEKYCSYFRFNADSKLCELADATVIRVSPSSEDQWAYYSKNTCTKSYQTSGYFKYIYPFPSFNNVTVFDFSVRAGADAILSLSVNGTFAGVAYEIVIGQSGNRYTVIRRVWNGSVHKSIPTEGVLSEEELRRFWFRYDRGLFSLGKYDEEAFFKWTDTKPRSGPVQYFGLGSWNRIVEWVVHQSCQ